MVMKRPPCDQHRDLVENIRDIQQDIRNDVAGLRGDVTSIGKIVSAMDARLELIIDGKLKTHDSKPPPSEVKAISESAKLLIKVVLFSAVVSGGIVALVTLLT